MKHLEREATRLSAIYIDDDAQRAEQRGADEIEGDQRGVPVLVPGREAMLPARQVDRDRLAIDRHRDLEVPGGHDPARPRLHERAPAGQQQARERVLERCDRRHDRREDVTGSAPTLASWT